MIKIILVDDDDINNFVNSQLIKQRFPEAEIRSFENPLYAIDFLKQGEKKPADVLLLDLNMPLMNGWEFLDQLKEVEIEIPVIVLTSSINQMDRERSEQYDLVKAFLVKPIDTEKLDPFLTVNT